MVDQSGWPDYLAQFHSDKAGITEDVLARSLDARGRSPYDWVVEPVPPDRVVLDLACGSGPLEGRLHASRYVGLDLSWAELGKASARSLTVCQADAARLPVADGVVDVVVMSMALMLVPLEATLKEIKRVLGPGGLLVATVPTSRPLPVRDVVRYGHLCLALRQRLSYPNDGRLHLAAFRAAGLTLAHDESRAFVRELTDQQQADQLLASLYLPDVAASRLAAGRRVARGWVGARVATPLRRLVAHA